MFPKIMSALVLGLSIASAAAMAQPPYVRIEQRLTPEQMKATGLDTLSQAQMALLNQLLRPLPAGLGTAGRPHADDASTQATFVGLDDRVIKSRLKGSVIEWGPGTVFELENGQSWTVLKGRMKLRSALAAPEVEVVPGVAGRWFIHIGDDLPGARVYRTD